MSPPRLEQLSSLFQNFAHKNSHLQLMEELVKRPNQYSKNAPLTEVLNSVSTAIDLSDDDFYEYCFSKLAITSPIEVFCHHQPTPVQLVYQFLDFIIGEEDEASGNITVRLFSKLIHETDFSLPTQDFLRMITKRYTESTRHLLPYLHLCANATLEVAAKCKSNEIYLFLRDGLCFWPALRSKLPNLSSPPLIKHLIYTRSHFNQQRRPLAASYTHRTLPKNRAV